MLAYLCRAQPEDVEPKQNGDSPHSAALAAKPCAFEFDPNKVTPCAFEFDPNKATPCAFEFDHTVTSFAKHFKEQLEKSVVTSALFSASPVASSKPAVESPAITTAVAVGATSSAPETTTAPASSRRRRTSIANSSHRRSSRSSSRALEEFMETLGTDEVFRLVMSLIPANRAKGFYPDYFHAKRLPLLRSELKMDPQRYCQALDCAVAAKKAREAMEDILELQSLLD